MAAAARNPEGLRLHRRIAFAAAGAIGIALLASIVLAADAGSPLTTRVVTSALALATVASLAVGLVAERRLGRDAVRVDLDASRRWVTLGNVHPAFVQAVRADQERRLQHQR